ncbi:helix-turn-helix domain-containing protein [Lactiplantibacillus plantarum]|uniref:helix-turn-helix domain-containing protein n=1 Tax=Lactiplantibacillus plantarum TaxID=1590 RepID=UPI0020444471|nr:helix-turn-helix transcriptional regulator [Lactiplantibacillus plantarum]MCM2629757.1 helix-turn-helix domain-containing protein [Lactiplantibacillus plantarum]MCS6155729.1 helix-turn-helix transcriptional regulator [Lactiplantibacillus plantarum]
MTLSVQLRKARKASGFSQNEIASVLHITRQSISKWENDKTYPDLDNLIQLSYIYQISLDDLLKEQKELRKKLGVTEQEIVDRKRSLHKVNTALYANKDEGIQLILMTLVSSLIPLVGIFLPMYVLWRNTKYNCLFKTIIVISISVILISIFNSLIITSDLFPSILNKTTVIKI